MSELTDSASFVLRVCYFTTDSVSQKEKFISLVRSFGAGGGFTCSLSDHEITRFVQLLKRSQNQKGRHSCWDVDPTSKSVCQQQWQDGRPRYFPLLNCTSGEGLSYTTHFNTLHLQLPGTLVQTTMKHNTLLVVGGAVMSCHYQQIVETFGGFPVVLACGPTETGKSTLLKVGL